MKRAHKRRIRLLIFLLLVAPPAWYAYQQYAGQPNAREAPAELSMTPALRKALADPAALLQPGGQADADVVTHTGFRLAYDEAREQARWVAYELRASRLDAPVVERRDRFRADPAVRSESASLKDYYKSGFDRGHLLPAAAMRWDSAAMADCFFLSNISPQRPGFNRGIWRKLEAHIRELTKKHERLLVLTGPVFDPEKPTTEIGPNGVDIPPAYFKVILDAQQPAIVGGAYLLPHEASKKPLAHFLVPIDSLEARTGLDFFPRLPDEAERILEARKAHAHWQAE